MKAEIHPESQTTSYKCACGNRFENLGTLPGEVTVEICNNCHPFFTGKEKLIDSAGRIEKFNRRYKRPDA